MKTDEGHIFVEEQKVEIQNVGDVLNELEACLERLRYWQSRAVAPSREFEKAIDGIETAQLWLEKWANTP